MSPKAPDPRVRAALIEAAARLLIEHGPDSLTTRRLSAEVGTSTMAVYTYFSGMDELRSAVAREGFDRLSGYLDGVETTDDPVADIVSLGGMYFVNAITNPDLYHFMFVERPEDDPECGYETFERLIAGVARAIEEGRFSQADPEKLAIQLWVMSHGIVTLHTAGMLTIEEAREASVATAYNLFVAFGDDPTAASQSLNRALEKMSDDGTLSLLLSPAPA